MLARQRAKVRSSFLTISAAEIFMPSISCCFLCPIWKRTPANDDGAATHTGGEEDGSLRLEQVQQVLFVVVFQILFRRPIRFQRQIQQQPAFPRQRHVRRHLFVQVLPRQIRQHRQRPLVVDVVRQQLVRHQLQYGHRPPFVIRPVVVHARRRYRPVLAQRPHYVHHHILQLSQQIKRLRDVPLVRYRVRLLHSQIQKHQRIVGDLHVPLEQPRKSNIPRCVVVPPQIELPLRLPVQKRYVRSQSIQVVSQA